MTTAIHPNTTPTISERLADYVVGLRHDDLPPQAVDSAKELLAYAFGAALRGHAVVHGHRAARTALDLSDAEGQYSIVGERHSADLLEAVFANSALIQCSGFPDWSPPGVNAGAVVQPIAWAIGEIGQASGRELLTAVIAGYEVIATLLGSVWGWGSEVSRPPMSVLGPFGGAATAARLFKLSRVQTMNAFGHAGQMGMGLFEGAAHRSIVYPLLARNGTMAAVLARAGWQGAPTIVEGSHGVYRTYFLQDVPESVHDGIATLGRDLRICDVKIRRYPTSILNHAPIELAQELVVKHSLSPSRIAGLNLVLPEQREQREAFYGAKPGSTRSLMALIAAGYDVTDPSYLEQLPPDLHTALDKVRLRFEPGHPLQYARVEVTTTEGETYSTEAFTYAAPPLNWSDWLTQSGQDVLSKDQLTRLHDLIRHLEDVPEPSRV